MGNHWSESILFLHGLTGSRRTWDSNFRTLADHYRLVFIDLLGFGDSRKPDSQYSVEEHLMEIEETLLSLGVDRTHVVGYSMGSVLALALARRRPELVGKIVLIAFPCFGDSVEARRVVLGSSGFNRWMATESWPARLACRIMCRFRPAASIVAPAFFRDLPPTVVSDALQHTWESYSRSLRRVLLEGRSRELLVTVRHPILIAQGNRDQVAPIGNIRAAWPETAGAFLLELDGDHGIVFTESDEIARRIGAFLLD
jgi:pimeloyl-ACP methyl ester carboxylesterase